MFLDVSDSGDVPAGNPYLARLTEDLNHRAEAGEEVRVVAVTHQLFADWCATFDLDPANPESETRYAEATSNDSVPWTGDPDELARRFEADLVCVTAARFYEVTPADLACLRQDIVLPFIDRLSDMVEQSALITVVAKDPAVDRDRVATTHLDQTRRGVQYRNEHEWGTAVSLFLAAAIAGGTVIVQLSSLDGQPSVTRWFVSPPGRPHTYSETDNPPAEHRHHERTELTV